MRTLFFYHDRPLLLYFFFHGLHERKIMFRTLLLVLFFFSGAAAANNDFTNLSVSPPYFLGTNSPGNASYSDGEGYREFATVAEICAFSTTPQNNFEFRNVDQEFSSCTFDAWAWSNYNQVWYFIEPRRTGYARPQWDECLFVNTSTMQCEDSYPADFADWYCVQATNDLWGNELTACTPPNVCDDEFTCYEFAAIANGCPPLVTQAQNDPFTDYNEDWNYVDPSTFSLECNLTTSDRTVDTVEDPWVNIDDPLDGGGSNSDPVTGGEIPNPIPDGSPDSTDDDTDPSTSPESFDDSFIIGALDTQTIMLNGQLNAINTSIKNVDDDGIIRSIDTQTTMLNEQLNSIGQSLDNSTDESLLNAMNNQIQTTEDILDILNENNDQSVLPSELDFDQINQQNIDDYNTDFQNTPIMIAMNNMTNLIVFPPGTCPPLTIDLSATLIGSTITTNIFCEILDASTAPLSVVMIACWSIAGFRIFAGA
jgi:hypothetical protein